MAISTVKILSGQTNSEPFSVSTERETVVGLETVNSMVGTATIQFQMSGVNGNFKAVKDMTGSDLKVSNAAANGYYPLDPAIFVGITKARLVLSSAPAADLTVYVHVEAI